MPSSAIHPVVLVLGAGTNVGAHVARTFAAKGYKVALAARRLRDETSAEGYLHIRSDFTDPESVTSAFEKAHQTFGPPSVVIYNASSCATVPAKSPLDLALADFHRDMAVNTASVLVAAKQAVLSFEQLPGTSSRTFIFTGNILNTEPILPLFSAGMGKSATAHLILNASMAYRDRGYKFYYADERKADGTVAGGAIGGDAHADFYLELAEHEAQGPWLATFVKDRGYVHFPGTGYVKAPTAA